MPASTRRLVVAALAVLVVVGGITAVWQIISARPRVSETEVRQIIQTSIQREAEASFLVTGYLEVTTTAIVDNTRILFPEILDLRLGTTRATVRAPGRISYGFEVSDLQQEMIYVDDDLIFVQIPNLQVYSTEPDLSQLEVETDIGWARLPASGRSAERRAVAELSNSLRRQGEAHLEDAVQPRLNTARALERLLVPVLTAAGIENPQIRFEVGEGLLME